MTDDELKTMLRAWQAPPAPDGLRRRVFPARRAWLRWLIAGELRVPVPLALAALSLAILAGTYGWLRTPAASLSDFEQVKRLEPRIVRTVYEAR